MFSSMEFSKLEMSKFSYIEQITGKKIQRRDQNLAAINLTDAAGFAGGEALSVARSCLANATDTPAGTALWPDTERHAVQ